jgi:hypothetical protein
MAKGRPVSYANAARDEVDGVAVYLRWGQRHCHVRHTLARTQKGSVLWHAVHVLRS